MYLKSVALLTLMGIAIGLFIGIFDSFLHFISYEDVKIVNILIFIIFFTSVYWSVVFFRNRLQDGLISYFRAFANIFYVGIIAAAIIAAVRYTYLTYVVKVDVSAIINQTKNSMISRYSYYSEEIINNRLSFIEFSYDPVVSSILYFGYYLTFVIIFAFLASFILRRIDRNISL